MRGVLLYIAMDVSHLQRKKIIHTILELGIVRKGLFTLKSGRTSTTYFNMRQCMSHPRLLTSICRSIVQQLTVKYDYVCGVAYGGVPFACSVSLLLNLPQIFVRSEVKRHGLGRRIEGLVNGWEERGRRVLLIEDVITTGQSVTEVADVLSAEGFEVDVLCIVDRREGDGEMKYPIRAFLRECDFDGVCEGTDIGIYALAFKRRSNVFFSADLETMGEISGILDKIHPYILGIKLHSDIIVDFDKDEVLRWKRTYGILVIEDMKLGDIGSISLRKVGSVASYADYVTYHALIGDTCVAMVKKAFPAVGLICVAEMSVSDSVTRDDVYVRYALSQFPISDGFVLQRRGIELLSGVHRTIAIPTFSPGISYSADVSGNNDTTAHTSPSEVSGNLGEFWIVGRGIYSEGNAVDTARRYQHDGWRYFLDACM